MTRVCAWCSTVMGETADESHGDQDTHGICPECLERFFPGRVVAQA